MGTTIDDLLQALETVDIERDTPNIILSTSFEITALVEHQIYHGLLSTGAKISPQYAGKDYAKKKALMNPLAGYGTPDAFLKGNFYNAMGVSVSGGNYDIESTVEYAQKLVNSYGDNFMRLSQANLKVYAEGEFFEAFKKYFTAKTGLIFV